MLARGFDWDEVKFRPRRIGEVVTLNYGKSLVAANRRPGSVPMFGTNGQCGTHDTSLSDGPGVILGRKGEGHLGVKWVTQPFWVIDTAYYATFDRRVIDPRWLYFAASFVGLDHLKSGEKPGLSRDTFGRQVFPFPDFEEQRKIGKLLGALDDKIELNRQTNRTLEELAAALFRSWFVDFDPVVTKAAGRTPFGLTPEVVALFPSTFNDSELGPIPLGWTIKPVGEAVDCVGGGTPSTREPRFWEGGTHHWTTPKDFSSLQSPVLLETGRKLTDAGIAKISSGLLPAGTLLLSSRAPVGYLAIAGMPVAINQGFIALKCNERASNFFMLNWCQMNMAEIESRATGTTFPEISKQNFRPIPVLLPSQDLMNEFTAKAAPLYAQLTANLRQSRTLAVLRDTLLPRLLSGELRVKDAENKVAAVV